MKKPKWVEISDNLNASKASVATSNYGLGTTAKRMKMAY